MAGPLYPDVPRTDGVPPVRRTSDNAGDGAEAKLTKDGDSVNRATSGEWGVYTSDGALALKPDNIVSVAWSAEYRTADYPLERGGFESYDKVALPFANRVVMSKGNSLSERREFLAAIEARRGTTDIFNVVTPEATYLDVTFERVNLERSASNGAGLVTVEVTLREVRQSIKLSFSKTKDPASADPVHDGSVQAKPSPAPTGVK